MELKTKATEAQFQTEEGYTLFTRLIQVGSSENAYLYLHEFGDSTKKLLEHQVVKDTLKKEEGLHYFFDLIGHGASSGSRGDIDKFSTYTKVLMEVLKSSQLKEKKTVIVSFGSSCLLIFALFRKFFLDSNKCISKLILVDPYFHSNKKLMSYLHEIELPESLKDLYHLRLGSGSPTLEVESLTWNFWREYLKVFKRIGEGLYFISSPVDFIETGQSTKVSRSIEVIKSLLIHTKWDRIHYNSSQGIQL